MPIQITPAIHALRHPFKIPVAPGIALDRFVYSYLLAGETITLIETGVAGCENTIFDYIRSIGRDADEISLIIFTHSHPDHIGAAKAIREVTGCSVMANPAEYTWIKDVELQNRERPVPGFSTLVGGSVTLDHELADGDVIDSDGTEEYESQRYTTHPVTLLVRYHSLCSVRGRCFVEMQYRSRVIFRPVTMPGNPYDR
jgi:glyoxylase-like metal-dependent hydrolase (beta-lactamase superfamily II)